MGYAVMAMKQVGIPNEKIKEILIEMHYMFDMHNELSAEQTLNKFYNVRR